MPNYAGEFPPFIYLYKIDTSPQAINVYIYVAGMIIVHGLAIPLCMLNLDVLYSRLLGRIKQGTMQGLFIALGDMLNVGGPMLIA